MKTKTRNSINVVAMLAIPVLLLLHFITNNNGWLQIAAVVVGISLLIYTVANIVMITILAGGDNSSYLTPIHPWRLGVCTAISIGAASYLVSIGSLIVFLVAVDYLFMTLSFFTYNAICFQRKNNTSPQEANEAAEKSRIVLPPNY